MADQIDFQPVLLGSDINVYGMARSFHEEYGLKSVAIGKGVLGPCTASKIVSVEVVEPKLEDDEVFVRTLLDFATRYKGSGKKLLLVPCGDNYIKLLVRNQAVDNTISVEDVRTRMEEQYPLAVPAFEQALADSGVERNDRVTVSPSRIKKLESRSFKTESGIEIKIPAELCNSDDAVEFIHSATGGLSLLIKDVLV